MAPLPKRRHSSRRQAKRTRALTASVSRLVKCGQCGEMKLPHRVCPKCGFYDGKQVITLKTKTKKTEV